MKVLHVVFDLRDNIFIGVMGNKLRRIRYEGGEGRDIDLPGIQQAYHTVLHPTLEKVLMLDNNKKFCVYKLVRIYMNCYSLCSVMMYLLDSKMIHGKVKS